MSVLVVGSVAFDTVKTPFGEAKKVLGGSAAYFSLAARFFSPVNLVAVVGEDFPSAWVSLFKEKGIDTQGLETRKGETFSWEGEYGWDFADPKTLATHLNVFAGFNPELPPAYKNSPYVFLANIDPQIQLEVLKQVSKPKLAACDTMNYWIKNSRKALLKLIQHVDAFILNESEAKELMQEANLAKAGKSLLKLGPRIIVIKKGEHGVLLFSADKIFTAPAFLLESILDPTGAGDTFAGGFIGYLAKCRKLDHGSLRKAVVYGSIMATFAVEDFSLNRLISLKPSDIKKRLNQFRKFTAF